jgi:hypothetical protein
LLRGGDGRDGNCKAEDNGEDCALEHTGLLMAFVKPGLACGYSKASP